MRPNGVNLCETRIFQLAQEREEQLRICAEAQQQCEIIWQSQRWRKTHQPFRIRKDLERIKKLFEDGQRLMGETALNYEQAIESVKIEYEGKLKELR